MDRRVTLSAVATAAVLIVSGCAASSTGSNTPAPSKPATAAVSGSDFGVGPSAASTACSPSSVHTKTSGALTVATDSPAYEPWFSGNKPSNGKGYESAVAFAVARQLGFGAGKVKWVVASFNSVIAPTPKKFDFDINEVSITSARGKVVDFSSGYYDVAQAVVSLKSDKYAKATSIAGLKGAKLAAQKGTTSLDAIINVIKPGRAPAEFPTNDLAVQALKNGQVDGLVVDLPTGLYVTSAQIQGATIIGQLPVTGSPEQFGLVLEKGSKLTACVTRAINALRANGTLKQLQQKWLTTSAGAPELK